MVKSQTQTFLAFVMIGILLIGFVGVYYVDAYYETNGDAVVLWESDSDAETNVGYTLTNTPYLTWDYAHTGQMVGWTGSPYVFETYNRTAVYTGNNTWTYSANETDGNYHNNARWIFEIPNIENWVIDSVNVSFSTNGDTDLQFSMAVNYPINYDVDYDRTEPRGTLIDAVYSFTPTDNYYFRNVSVPLATALDINNNVNNIEGVNPVFEFSMNGGNDGLSAWAFSISIVINGYRIDTTSMIDQISIVIGISVCLNVIAIVYLTDEIDLGGYTKDIKKVRK